LALFVVYGLAGLAGYFLFRAGGIDNAARPYVLAVLEGAAGYGALRAQFERMSLGGEQERGRSLLSLVRDWIVEWLRIVSRRNVGQWLSVLSDELLVSLTFEIFWEHADPVREDDAVAAKQHELLREAADQLDSGGNDHADARGRLRGFCLREIEQFRLTTRGSHG
jgi:hypothetical protein